MKRISFLVGIAAFFAFLFTPWTAPFTVAEDNVIKIGVIGPMKFSHGIATWTGASIAAEEINGHGGVTLGDRKYRIELVKSDSNEYLSVTDAISAMEKLITVDKVNYILGGFRSEAVFAMQEVMTDNKILFMSVQAAHPKLCGRIAEDYDKYKYYFRIGSLNSVYLGELSYAYLALVKEALKSVLGIEKPRVAIQYEKAVWADPIVSTAQKRLPELGFEIVRVGRNSATATDVTGDLSAIKAADAQIIWSGGAGPVQNVLPKQWGELEIPAALVSISSVLPEKKHWEATGGGCNYELGLCPVGRVAITPKTIPFYDEFHKRIDDYPTTGGGIAAYDWLFVLREAIERARSLKSDDLVPALEKTDYTGAEGRIVFHPPQHKWPHDAIWGPEYITYTGAQWQDQSLEIVWPDGRALWGDERWKGVKFEGTKPYKLPPRMITYWKGKR